MIVHSKSPMFSVGGVQNLNIVNTLTIFIFCTPPPDFIGVFEGQIVLQFWGLKIADFIGEIELDIFGVDVQNGSIRSPLLP